MALVLSNRAVFLDKDGTLVEDIPYNVDPDQVRLCAGVVDALRSLQHAGYQLIVVSNQSGVARGMFPERALFSVERKLRALLAYGGVVLTDFLYCPHHPEGVVPEYAVDCDCRKPNPGMLLRGARQHGIDLSISWMVGDILDDVQAGSAAGCRTILLDNGHETEWQRGPGREPDLVVASMRDAADAILAARPLDGWNFNDGNTQQRSANHD